MFHSDDVATNGQTIAIWRHLPAALVDLALISGPTAMAIAALHERFPILATTDGSPRFSPADQSRINEIDQGFNRGIRLGDDIYTLSGSGWWLTMLTLSWATIIVFVVVPALMGRRTAGQRLVGMQPIVQSTDLTLIESTSIDLSDSANHDEVAVTTSDDPPSTVDVRDEPMLEAFDPLDPLTPTLDLPIGGLATPSTIDVDVIDHPPTMPITLADESEYERWDREQARVSPGSSTGGASVLEQAAPHDVMTPTGPPEWSADWNAWMYWDSTSKRWFRHDTAADRWTPVS